MGPGQVAWGMGEVSRGRNPEYHRKRLDDGEGRGPDRDRGQLFDFLTVVPDPLGLRNVKDVYTMLYPDVLLSLNVGRCVLRECEWCTCVHVCLCGCLRT